MRGEKADRKETRARHRGSPPHARGKGETEEISATDSGITPACAGKSCRHRLPCDPPRDHPRMRGEKRARWHAIDKEQGSPPHARGKAHFTESQYTYMRITPACAGKRAAQFRQDVEQRDHPRMRGEKSARRCGRWTALGSPPHARGKEEIPFKFGNFQGITPACAGKSCYARDYYAFLRDHPRMRGEKQRRVAASILTVGSPPHARGKADKGLVPRRQMGITPACAGKRSGHRRGQC